MRGSLNAMEEDHKVFFQEPGARIRGLDFADDMDSGDGVHWPEPAGGADMLHIVSKFGSGADVCSTFVTAPGILSPKSDAMLLWMDFMCGLGQICRTWCVQLLKGRI